MGSLSGKNLNLFREAGGSNPSESTNIFPSKTTHNRVRTQEFNEFLRDFEKLAYEISADRLKKMMKILSKARKERFSKNPSKCEGIDRTFTDEELGAFFAALPSEKYRILFLVQFTLSLRISEITPLNLSQINFQRHTISIFEQKTGRILEKPVPASIWGHLSAYIDARRRKIEANKGYVWYSQGGYGKKHDVPHNTVDYLRKVFREAREKAGLNTIYGHSTAGTPLYTLGTHSFRRTGTSRMAEALNGNIFELKAYTGHKSAKSLESYVFVDKEKVKKKVDEVFK